MIEWSAEVLKSSALSVVVFPAAFLLGLMGSVTSCCNLPLLGAIAGYSGTMGHGSDRRALWVAAFFFMLGTVGAFAALGAVSGFIGLVAGASLGLYWKLFAGFVSVLFGLVTLGFLPFDFARLGFTGKALRNRSSGATLYGLAVGGGAAACSVCCNPVLPVALMVTTLQGHTLWGAAILTIFSIGYSLPMVGVLVGLGLGFRGLTSVVQKINPIIQRIAGILLIVVGFYLLATP
ncbi:MAG: cytochrome c biogenesis protein CcdA [Pseudomonadota bacterium]